jgi:hypothetical protein
MGKLRLLAVLGVLLGTFSSVQAGYIGFGGGGVEPLGFVPLSTKWAEGPNAAEFGAPVGGWGTPGRATWSIMGAGITVGGFETHIPSVSFAAILAVIPGGIDAVMNVWASVSGFDNLGGVADSGASGGALETAGGHIGDIRIGNYTDLGGELAHAYQPGTQALGGAGGTVLGDVHFEADWNWVNDATDDNSDGNFDFDAFTVMLHELLGRSDVGHVSVLWRRSPLADCRRPCRHPVHLRSSGCR